MVVTGETEKRDLSLDVLKGFLIYLVVLGHCIQALDRDFWTNELFEFIYSFHMPLFAFISGYFAYTSLTNQVKVFFIKRSIQLLFPVISWSILVIVATIIMNRSEHLMGVIKPNMMYYLWFLKCIWLCSIICFCIFRYIRNIYISSLAMLPICLFFSIKSDWGGYCWLNFLLPYYGVGLVVYGLKTHYVPHPYYRKISLPLFCFIYLMIYFLFWDCNQSIYAMPICFIDPFGQWDLDNIITSSLRWIIGFSASFILLMEAKRICLFLPVRFCKMIGTIGKNSLGIYIIHTTIFSLIAELNILGLIVQNQGVRCLLIFLLSITMTFVSWKLVQLIEMNRLVSLFFLGKNYTLIL